jgi:hypothetical protein
MRRQIALYAMFLLFGCAYATLDRVPRSAIQILRGAAEHVLRSDDAEIAIGPEG